jgi:hypothetical protein
MGTLVTQTARQGAQQHIETILTKQVPRRGAHELTNTTTAAQHLVLWVRLLSSRQRSFSCTAMIGCTKILRSSIFANLAVSTASCSRMTAEQLCAAPAHRKQQCSHRQRRLKGRQRHVQHPRPKVH